MAPLGQMNPATIFLLTKKISNKYIALWVDRILKKHNWYKTDIGITGNYTDIKECFASN